MKISIVSRLVGEDEPCFIIAEAGVNHNGSIELAKKLVDAAKNAGADAVKFQTFKAENLVTKNAPMASYQAKNVEEKDQLDMLKKLELSYEDFKELRDYCDKRGIIFLSTPHTEEAAEFLDDMVPAFKIGSGDLNNISFLEKTAKKGKPIILSTGMGTLEEVKEAVDTIKKHNKKLILLHCTTSYPCPKKDVNLKAMKTMKDKFHCPVGYSDHTLGIEVPVMAASLGAAVIEKHFTLDKNMEGPDHKASLNPEELTEMIKAIRNKKRIDIPKEILGTGIKEPTKQELEIAEVVRKSITAAEDIPANTTITKEMLAVKRPGRGIEPKDIELVIGKRAKKDIPKDSLIQWQDLKQAKQRHILYVTGTRADYGLMKNTLSAIKNNPNLKLSVMVTGMHLMPEFGETVNEIKKDGFDIHEIDAVYKEDDKESMSVFLGEFIQRATKKISEIKPDIILVLGDRAEMLGAAIIGAYLSIPVAHLHGGEVTSTVDEIVRHTITKLAHIHIPATKNSAERIKNMGEEGWRIHVVGAPGLDEINTQLFKKKYLEKKFKLDLIKPLLIVIQHPVTLEVSESGAHMTETMEAVKSLNFQTVVIYPNTDAGGRAMIRIIEKYRGVPTIKIFKNIIHKEFLSLMKYASVVIGNSSSGIIEAPSFKLPVVNIGKRQRGRQRADNIIDTDYNKEKITRAIKKALYDKKFINKVKVCKNPYGDGKTGQRVAKILSEIKIDKELLQKKISY